MHKMASPRVSVIMPYHNAQAYLTEAVESVRAQTFPDWQLLLIDDGSTDGGPDIARRHAEIESRIVLLASSPGRRGAAAARNLGIRAAAGEFVAFLDSDDWFEPGKLANDIAALDSDPEAAWVYGATRWFYEDRARRDYFERLGVRRNRRYAPPTLLNRIILEERGDIPCTCGVMIRKEPLEAVGGFEESFALYEDQTLWVKLLLAYPVRVISGCHAVYRQHPASTSTAASAAGAYNQSSAHPARDAFLNWVWEYAAQRNAPATVFKSLAVAKSANDGRALSRLLRTARKMSRLIY